MQNSYNYNARNSSYNTRTYRPTVQRVAQDSFNFLDRVNIFSIIKVVLVITVLIVLIFAGKGIVKTVKGWFGFSDETGFIDILTGNVKKTPAEQAKEKAEAEEAKALVTAGQRPELKSYIEYVDIKQVKKDPRPIVDEIKNGFSSVWGAIPFTRDYDQLNSLASRNTQELRLACRYWDEKYSAQFNGQSFYQYLTDGVGISWDMEPTHKKLKSLGLTVKMRKHWDKNGKLLKK